MGEEIKEYDDRGNLIHYKGSYDYEFWNEYDENNNEIHYKDNEGDEWWYKWENGKQIKISQTEFEQIKRDKEPINDYYNLIIEDDIEPYLQGPFLDMDSMSEAADHHRECDPDKRDGIYHLTIPKGTVIEIRAYCRK